MNDLIAIVFAVGGMVIALIVLYVTVGTNNAVHRLIRRNPPELEEPAPPVNAPPPRIGTPSPSTKPDFPPNRTVHQSRDVPPPPVERDYTKPRTQTITEILNDEKE